MPSPEPPIIAYTTRDGRTMHTACYAKYSDEYRNDIGTRPALPERLLYRVPRSTRCAHCQGEIR